MVQLAKLNTRDKIVSNILSLNMVKLHLYIPISMKKAYEYDFKREDYW